MKPKNVFAWHGWPGVHFVGKCFLAKISCWPLKKFLVLNYFYHGTRAES